MKKPKRVWTSTPDKDVRHVWACEEEDCDQPAKERVCKLPPTYYQDNGEPMCGCDRQMTYIRTEVRLWL